MADMFLPSRLSHLYPCWILQPQCLLFTPAFKHLFPYSSWCGCHHIQILETSLVLSLLRPISMLSPVQRMAVLLSARTEETHETFSCWKWSQASWNQESSEPPTFCHGKKYSVLRVGPRARSSKYTRTPNSHKILQFYFCIHHSSHCLPLWACSALHYLICHD